MCVSWADKKIIIFCLFYYSIQFTSFIFNYKRFISLYNIYFTCVCVYVCTCGWQKRVPVHLELQAGVYCAHWCWELNFSHLEKQYAFNLKTTSLGPSQSFLDLTVSRLCVTNSSAQFSCLRRIFLTPSKIKLAPRRGREGKGMVTVWYDQLQLSKLLSKSLCLRGMLRRQM